MSRVTIEAANQSVLELLDTRLNRDAVTRLLRIVNFVRPAVVSTLTE